MPRRRPANALAAAVVAAALAAAAVAQPAPAGPGADFVLPDPAVRLPEAVAAGAAAIRAEALAAHVAFLASPALAGRGLDTPGLAAAAEYGAAALAIAGAAPFGDQAAPEGAARSYFQAVPAREVTEHGVGLTVERRDGERRTARSFAGGVDVLAAPLPPRVIAGPLVFAGFGIREESAGRDDYRGLDVRGALVVTLAGVPDEEAWRDEALHERWAARDGRGGLRARAAAARALGAAAVLVVERDRWAEELAGEDAAPSRFFLPLEEEPDAEGGVPVVRVSPAVGETLGVLGGPATPPHGRLPGLVATLEARGRERAVRARNVLAIVPGGDGAVSGEAVVVGAHYDHLGTVDGRAYPGADDNASGVAALLEIARALAARPPRRSVVLALWTGEEDGHLGSLHYAAHPRWPLAGTVAYLNLDMIGHPWLASEIADLVRGAGVADAEGVLARVAPADFVEPGVASWSPELGEVLRRAGQGLGLALHLDRTDGRTGGSDYRSFARRGVPFVRFFGNFFPAYHEPGDTPEALDPAQVQRVARLAYATARLLADR